MTPQPPLHNNYRIAIAYEFAVSHTLGIRDPVTRIDHDITNDVVHMELTRKIIACPVDIRAYRKTHGSLAGLQMGGGVGETAIEDLELLLARGVRGLMHQFELDNMSAGTNWLRSNDEAGHRVGPNIPDDQSPGPSWDLAYRYLEEE